MTKDDIFNAIIGTEGGYVSNPNDTGGATRWGITEKVARAHGYKGNMQTLPRETAVAIYEADYWTAPGFNKVAEVSMDVAVELTDTGVNMGPAVAAKFLQRCLNVFNNQGKAYADITADGQVGAKTIAALKAFKALRGDAGIKVLMTALNCLQGARYIELAETRAANETFIYGWLANRVEV